MSVMIWDSTSQAFKESDVPLVYDTENSAWRETNGFVWDEQNQAWVEKWNITPKALVPIMTKNEQDGYKAFHVSDSIGNNTPYLAFDGNKSSCACFGSHYSDNPNTILAIMFPTLKTVVSMSFESLNYEYYNNYGVPGRFHIVVSDDGSNWTVIKSVDNGKGGASAVVNVELDSPIKTKCIGIKVDTVLSTAGGYRQRKVAILQFYGF